MMNGSLKWKQIASSHKPIIKLKLPMKKFVFVAFLAIMALLCKQKINPEEARNEIMKAETDFAAMAAEKGLAEAFWFFAADSAVINRANDSLIKGKENIRNFYEKNSIQGVKLTWAPDFIEVSECGTLGYTYGKYQFSKTDSTGKVTERTGTFHTVWKKMNGKWRFVWD